jgi:YHS domain-containing protein
MNPSNHIVPLPGLLQGIQPCEAEKNSSLAAFKDKETLAFVDGLVPARALETVCHRTISGDPAYYPQAEFHGRTIYFCTDTCQGVFRSDPERFFAAHSKRKA